MKSLWALVTLGIMVDASELSSGETVASPSSGVVQPENHVYWWDIAVICATNVVLYGLLLIGLRVHHHQTPLYNIAVKQHSRGSSDTGGGSSSGGGSSTGGGSSNSSSDTATQSSTRVSHQQDRRVRGGKGVSRREYFQ